MNDCDLWVRQDRSQDEEEGEWWRSKEYCKNTQTTGKRRMDGEVWKSLSSRAAHLTQYTTSRNTINGFFFLMKLLLSTEY